MLIKICGMREPDNIRAVASLRPDMMGFVFYPFSPRYAGKLEGKTVAALPEKIERVGVFVNENPEGLMKITERYGIHTIQLHGDETPECCRLYRNRGYKVIKALGIETEEDLCRTSDYTADCDLLLFDTRSQLYGGTGQAFDWEILKEYRGKIPFLLSGGISEQSSGELGQFRHPCFAGIDLNSRFETIPGRKDTERLSRFLHSLSF